MDDEWSKAVNFSALCDFFESLSKNGQKKENESKSKKMEKLRRFLADCRRKFNNESLFPIVRLLIPQMDRERGSYGIKETILAKLFIDLLKMGPNSSDALKLKNYKSQNGDFANVLYNVIKDRAYDTRQVSIHEVNEQLDKLVLQNAQKKGVNDILMEMFRKMDAIMIKWLVRIILKDIKLAGLGPNVILHCLHQDAKEMFDSNANLRKVCLALKNPQVRLHEIEISLFTAFKPMLAENVPIDQIEGQMGQKPFYIEVKYDGERMLAHRDQNKAYRFYSRNLHDFTDDFGANPYDTSKFAQFIEQALAPDVQSAILDGEICPFNKQLGTLTQKGEQMNIRQLKENDPVYQQCLYVYDIVYLNGQVLTNKRLSERIEILRKAIPQEIPGRVHFAHNVTASTKADVIEALNKAIDLRDEGIMIKDPDSIYKPGSRSKSGWIKVKPEYCLNLTDTCDLVVLGAYHSSGQKVQVPSHFLCGIKDGDTFRSFTRVGSGVSHKDLFDLAKKLKYLKKPLSIVKYGKERPDLIVDPRSSVILEIRAAEIVRSDTYDVGCTLRFPRVLSIRHDKSWSDCMTLADLEALKATNEGKLSKRHLDPNDEGSNAKRRKVSITKPSLSVDPIYQPVSGLAQIKAISKALTDKVLVVEASRAHSDLKAKLEKTIVEHGGIVEQNVLKGHTWAFVQTANTLKAKNVVKSGICNVIKADWLSDGLFRPLRPSDMVWATEDTLEAFKANYDKFGDGFGLRATVESLKFSMEQVKLQGQARPISQMEMADFEHEHNLTKFGLFRPLTAFFDEGLQLVKLMFEFFGGQIKAEVEPGLAYYVISGLDSSVAKAQRRLLKAKFKIVNPDWIEQCVEQGELISDNEFLL